MNQEDILLDVTDGIATVTFNRPEKRNPMGLTFSATLNAVLDRVEANRDVRCVILTGAGRTFCGGGDLREIMSPDPTDMEAELALVRGYNMIAKRLYYFDLPVIAAVNGPAVGGGAGIALACDFAIASTTASYDLFFHRLGLSGADVGVPRDHMAHLMRQHGSQLRSVIGQRDQAARNVEMPVRQREGVDRRRVQHGHAIFEIRALRCRDQTLDGLFDRLLQAGVFIDAAIGGQDARVLALRRRLRRIH